MSKAPSLATRIVITLILCGILIVLFEFYLRREVSYIVQKGVRQSAGVVNQDPEFLVNYTNRGRRFIPHAEVTIVNHFISHEDVEVKINSMGYRDDESAVPKPPGLFRVVVLGDSITAGDYLPKDEVFVERIQYHLQKFMNRPDVDVINTGIGNIGTEEEINILEDGVEDLTPDVVVLGFYLNDSRPPWGFAGEIGDRGWLRRHSLLAEMIYRNIKQYDWVEEQGKVRFGWIKQRDKLDWKRDRGSFLKLAAAAESDWGAAWVDRGWEEVEKEFDRLERLSTQYGFKVLVTPFPVSFQVYADFIENTPQVKLEKLSRSHGFEFLDLLPLFRSENSDPDLFYDQCHPKKKANDFVGKAIAEYIHTRMMK